MQSSPDRACWDGSVPIRRLGVVFAFALSAACGFAAPAYADGGAAEDRLPPPLVKTLLAGRLAVGGQSIWDGLVQAGRRSSVAAQSQARILSLDVKAGDRVKAGQRIALLDGREAQAGLAQASARAAQTRAELENARVEFRRSESLRQKGFISQAALDGAKARYRAAQAAAGQAQAAVRMQQVTGTYTTIVSPYDARISSVAGEVGELAAPGRILLEMYEDGRLRVAIYVPTNLARALDEGVKGRVELPGPAGETIWSDPLDARVLPSADETSATVEVRFDLPAGLAASFVPGQHVKVRTDGEGVAGLAVPVSALLTRGELRAVYVSTGERFLLRAVRPGLVESGMVQILAGLREGERIAVDPVRAGLSGARPSEQ